MAESVRDRLARFFSEGGQAGLEGYKQSQNAKLEQLLLGQKNQQQIEQEQRQRAAAEEMSKKAPGSAVRVGEVSINPDATSLQDQVQQSRLETKALQDEFNRMGIGDTRKKMTSLTAASKMLQDPKGMDAGKLASITRNLIESGVATEQDIQRFDPTTWRSIVNKIGAFAGIPSVVKPYSPEMLTEMRRFIDTQKGSLAQQAGAASEELKQRAPMLAPTLQRQGKLGQVTESLGTGIQSILNANPATPPEPQQPGQLSPRQQRIQQLRQKLGK